MEQTSNLSGNSSVNDGRTLGQPSVVQGTVVEVDVEPGLGLRQPYNGVLWLLVAAVLTVLVCPLVAACARLSAISRRMTRRLNKLPPLQQEL
jgi:hypothetical protein